MLKTVSLTTNAIGALNYKGTWNATTNTPALASGIGTKGDYYVVSVAGTTTLNGISNWGIGDWAVFNGTDWQRVEGGADLNGVNLTVSGTSSLATATATTLNSIYQKILTATVNASSTQTLTIDFSGIAGRAAQFQISAEVSGNGAGSICLEAQGFLTNANYYSLVESGKFSYLAIVMGSATKGNNKITIPITNNHTGAANVVVMGIANMDFSVSVA